MKTDIHTTPYLDSLAFDDVSVGNIWKSPEREIRENDVREFAELTGDYNPIHLDEEFASETPFRKRVAHGLLGLSFLAGMSSEYPCMDTLAFLGISEWKFLKPIYFGDVVHVETEVIEKTSSSRRYGNVVWHRRLMNQAGEVVQEGKFGTLVRKRQQIPQGQS